MSKMYQINKILLCTTPKNNLNLKDPPNLPFMKSPSSIYILNRVLRFSYNSFFKDNGDGNKYVYELKQQVPEIVIPFLWVNPLDPLHISDLEKNIQNYQSRGIKLHQAWNPFAIDGSEFKRLVEVAKTHKLPVFIHLYSKKETQKLLRFIGNNHDVTFIIAHMLGLGIFREMKLNLPNVYFDTSQALKEYGERILCKQSIYSAINMWFSVLIRPMQELKIKLPR